MDVGILLSVIQTLLAALQCSQLKELWSIWGYKSELDELYSVVATVKKVLLHAEAKYDELSPETLLYIEELRDVLYDADDLLDEFVTLAKQKELMEDDKFIKKVSHFFSRYFPVGVANKMSKGVKKIMKKLDGIASKHSKFGLNIDHGPITRRREETCSHSTIEIIGRDEDLEQIVGTLLNSDDQRDFSFLTIVGIGGLGKTALAQLVYNDERIAKEFPLRLWTCISDHDQSKLDVKAILAQILESATHQKHNEYSIEVVVSRLREILAQKRFLIVLDDLWTESRDEWEKLVGHLVGGGGSRIVVTTRSTETAKIVGNGHIYELKGLSDEYSWRLFQLMAFGLELDQASSNQYDDFINVGQDIVKKCANVPLAIRVIGRLLYGQDKSKWLSLQESGFVNLREDQNGVKPILRLSYHNLPSSLKSCFSYCSLYPKDFRLNKEVIISLWMAQGYIVPLEKGQSIEEASEEYFLILLQRCFFQDVGKNCFGDILTFKLHDLMHDVALEVSEKEMSSPSSYTGNVDEEVRHVSLLREQYAKYTFSKARIRTFLHLNRYPYSNESTMLRMVTENYKCLRALELRFLGVKIIPASIGKLIHLRYLNLSYNAPMEGLPKSITKLYNLQTLNLDGCTSLKELPKDISKLANLRVLRLSGCYSLMCLPLEIRKLTNLNMLHKFMVMGKGNSYLQQHVQLEGLKALKKLRGKINIEIHTPESGAFVMDGIVREEAYIRDKEHLKSIVFEFKHASCNQGALDYEEELLGVLQPHANLKVLVFVNYAGVRMPRWAKEDNLSTFLPNIVHLRLAHCSQLQCLSSLRKLQHLKTLELDSLQNLEYVESQPRTASSSGSSEKDLRFFPCLEVLKLFGLPKLKGWCEKSWEDVASDSSSVTHEPHRPSLRLHHLKDLVIQNCPELTFLAYCPKVENLTLFNFNVSLRIVTDPTSCPKLRLVEIDNLAWFHSSLPMESVQSLTYLAIQYDKDVENLADFAQVFQSCSSLLRTLQVDDCPKLRRISGGLGNLASLETLILSKLQIENLADEDEKIDGETGGNGLPWGFLSHTLQYLCIYGCKELQSFPKWMSKLTSLRELHVSNCQEELYERCQNPTGEDWPNIQHIPDININRR